ncbi:hypothetical protein CXB51_032329 [Gossypium anomalum]|uniref:Reverse transcriptase domain-containing protein n=1 Tax=Gossypium anomalum TaxID=47600 RepID=A0A8J5Y2Z4_9ROSI|nr:hypothetical protein CXB51_032329 [Gossypium anomalum]
MNVIANRFKSIFLKIIGQEKVGFITGRSIIDNVIITQEVLHSMRTKKKLQWMTIKIDLKKAYEKVLWNGAPTRKFRPIRGIRQGCPLSPYLFVLYMEWLGHRFHAGISSGEWSPIRLSRIGPNLSHMFFAADLVIFSRADLIHSGLLKNFLSNFCELSGHKVLKAKYRLCESMLDSIMRNSCSYMWKAVAKAWPLLRSNMIWTIRNGRTVRCWEDNWVLNVGPLNQYVPGHGNIVLGSKVNEMVLVNSDWNLDLFRLTTTDVFSMKTAYYMLKEESWNLKEKLLTNSERVRRSIAQDASCHLCGYITEDILYILRDCSFAKEIWHHVIPANHLGTFFGNISEWLFSNLQSLSTNKTSESYWACLFGIILWCIWKNRGVICNSKCSVAVAELWGILDGLLLLQKQGYDEVITQSDNLENIIFISESKLGGPKNSPIRRIQQTLAFEEKWSLAYVPRETNWGVDALAKMALLSDESLHMFEDPPLGIIEILKDDNSFDNLSMIYSM